MEGICKHFLNIYIQEQKKCVHVLPLAQSVFRFFVSASMKEYTKSKYVAFKCV